MKKFQFKKLVRDKVIDGFKSEDNKAHYRILEKDEYIVELKRKLLEETAELSKEANENMLEELADIQEIIDNLVTTTGNTKSKLQKAQDKKNDRCGSFKNKIYIDHVEASENNAYYEYFLKNSDRYPEIK